MNKKNLTRDGYHLSDFYHSESSGRYNIPKIKKEFFIPPRIIDFSQALTSDDFDAGVHFYIDDERFERFWRTPQRYLPILKRFSCVFSPDFSLYRDMPLAMKIWNIYRSRLLGQIMQRANILVIPTVTWAEKDTFSFCFSGIERGSVVTVSTLGILRSAKARCIFCEGFVKLCLIINPKVVLIYGNLPNYDFGKIKIIQYKYSRFDWKKQKHGIY